MADKRYRLDFTLSDSSIKSVEFTAPQGEKGDKGDTGAAGKDYVLTSADKAEIAQQAAALVPSGGGGGSGISVTAEVGQTIIVKAVDSNGKPTEWEAADYQPRTHWSEEVEVLPETTVEFDPDSGDFFLPKFDLEAGKEYTVNYNGTEYVSTCIEADPDAGLLALGNIPRITETGDNGLPFVIVYSVYEEGRLMAALDGSETVTLSIVQKNYTPIPVEYVANALPYCIEVTGDGTTDDPYVCNDTVANVNAIHNSGREIKLRVRCSFSGTAIIDSYYQLSICIHAGDAAVYYFAQMSGMYDSVNTSYRRIILVPNEDGTFSVTEKNPLT